MASIDNSLDELLPKIGGFGVYQAYILTMICLTSGIMHPSIYLSFIFAARQVKHRCKIPQCDTKTSKYDEKWSKFAVPKDNNGVPEKCLKYSYIGDGGCEENDFDKKKTESCSDWIYDGDEWTILHEFNMQCPENTKWFTMVGVFNNLGQFLGLYLVGYTADRYGRRLIKVCIMVISAVIGVLKLMHYKLWWYLLMEFLDAMIGAGAYICGFVLVSEVMPLNWRAFAGNVLGSAFAIGTCYLALIAYLAPHWWYIVLIVHVPNFFVILYLWLIPESIRWNLVNGRSKEAKRTLRKIAKINRKPITEEDLAFCDHLRSPSSGYVSNSRLKSALKSKVLVLRLIVCAFCWFANNFVYYGMVYNSVHGLSDNIYLDFTLQGLVEIPAYFLIEVVVRLFGRKKPMIGSYAVSCIACTIFIFVSQYQEAKRALWFLSKFFSTMSPGIIYIYTNELFPTYLRQSFMGTCSSFGKIGAMIAPVHKAFAQIWIHLPLILYAAVSGLAMLVVLFFFPETRNKKLPDTVHEAEDIKYAQEINTKHDI